MKVISTSPENLDEATLRWAGRHFLQMFYDEQDQGKQKRLSAAADEMFKMAEIIARRPKEKVVNLEKIRYNGFENY